MEIIAAGATLFLFLKFQLITPLPCVDRYLPMYVRDVCKVSFVICLNHNTIFDICDMLFVNTRFEARAQASDD